MQLDKLKIVQYQDQDQFQLTNKTNYNFLI